MREYNYSSKINSSSHYKDFHRCILSVEEEEKYIGTIQNEILILKERLFSKDGNHFIMKVFFEEILSDYMKLISKIPASYIKFIDIGSILNIYEFSNRAKEGIALLSLFSDKFILLLDEIIKKRYESLVSIIMKYEDKKGFEYDEHGNILMLGNPVYLDELPFPLESGDQPVKRKSRFTELELSQIKRIVNQLMN